MNYTYNEQWTNTNSANEVFIRTTVTTLKLQNVPILTSYINQGTNSIEFSKNGADAQQYVTEVSRTITETKNGTIDFSYATVSPIWTAPANNLQNYPRLIETFTK